MTDTASQPVPLNETADRLRAAGLRPTRQRIALADLLFGQGNRHVSAEELRSEAASAGIKVSLATIYNTLHQFTHAGLLREVTVESGRAWFDTNLTDHHHFLTAENGDLIDIPADSVELEGLPVAPEGHEIDRVDVIIRLKPRTGNA